LLSPKPVKGARGYWVDRAPVSTADVAYSLEEVGEGRV
jgi:hypothetical protein